MWWRGNYAHRDKDSSHPQAFSEAEVIARQLDKGNGGLASSSNPRDAGQHGVFVLFAFAIGVAAVSSPLTLL